MLLAAVDRTHVGRVAELLTATGSPWRCAVRVVRWSPWAPARPTGSAGGHRQRPRRPHATPLGAVRLIGTGRRVRVALVALSAALVLVAAARLRNAGDDRPA